MNAPRLESAAYSTGFVQAPAFPHEPDLNLCGKVKVAQRFREREAKP